MQRKLQSMTQLYNSCAHNLKQKDTEKEQLLEKLKHTNHTVTLLQESLERKRSQERIYQQTAQVNNEIIQQQSLKLANTESTQQLLQQ